MIDLAETDFHSDAPYAGLMSPTQWMQVRDLWGLTPREVAVCELLFRAITRQEIASSLGISSRTVRQHLEQVHRKLHVTNRVGVVLRIIQTRDRLAEAAK